MTRNQFVSLLLENGVENATVISSPDYMGGERLLTVINCKVIKNLQEIPEDCQENPDKYGYYVLEDFEYVVFHGDTTDIFKNKNRTLTEHREVRYQGKWDNEFPLEWLIWCAVTGTLIYDYKKLKTF